jgi:hypothetical protein
MDHQPESGDGGIDDAGQPSHGAEHKHEGILQGAKNEETATSIHRWIRSSMDWFIAGLASFSPVLAVNVP